ncbi:50S ribosomal protein L6 [Candidatus Woesearchaeota archaeon]|nr:50S ribosomal protein L6 [Candidatus Woesearchaeota archaeon]
MKLDMQDRIELPSGVTALVKDFIITIKGPKGEVKRRTTAPQIKVTVDGNAIALSVTKGTKREKTSINTLAAHVRNMIKGVQQPWVYKLKVCSSHFPMNVSLSGKDFTIKNLFGEKVPRTMKLKEGVTVKVAGQDITVESTDLELAGNTASDIEQLSRITHVDRRVFQDGIHMIEKCGVKVE